MKCYCRRKTQCMIVFSAFLEALWISRFSFFLSILAGFEYSLRSFAHQFTTIHKQPLWGPEIACSKIYRVHAAVSIRRMYVMKTLIASTNSLHWPKNTEQTARKSRCKRAFTTYFRKPRRKAPTYPSAPGRSLFHEIKICQDSTNSNNLSAMVIVQ